MASSPSSPTRAAAQAKADWRVHPNCPTHLAVDLTNVVMALPASYFLAPQSGEVFESVDAALARLNGYALTQGFAWSKLGFRAEQETLHLFQAYPPWRSN
jgi:hypothetical protein